MKAVILEQIGGPEQLRVSEVTTPEPGPGQVRVRLHASALNRRDVWITLGQYPKIRLAIHPGFGRRGRGGLGRPRSPTGLSGPGGRDLSRL